MPVDRSNLTGVALVLLAGILWGAMGTSVQYLFSSGAFETPLELVTLRQLCAGSLFVLVMSLVRPRAIWRLWTDRRERRAPLRRAQCVLRVHLLFERRHGRDPARDRSALVRTLERDREPKARAAA